MGEDATGSADRLVDAVARAGPGEVDQVSAAREWLRGLGVDPVDAEPAREARPEPGEAAAQGGYDRSRRAASSGGGGVGGGSFSRRRPRYRHGDDEDAGAGAVDGADDAGRADGAGKGTGRASSDPDADPAEVARGIVLRKLAVQARTRVELERALQGRDVPEEAAAAVLDRMTEVGLVDDVTFANDWVSSRQQRRSLSRSALRRELQAKGVERDVIDDALVGVGGDDEHRAALDLARRRAATMTGLAREVAYRRLGGVLARRGFSASITTGVLAEVLEGWGHD